MAEAEGSKITEEEGVPAGAPSADDGRSNPPDRSVEPPTEEEALAEDAAAEAPEPTDWQDLALRKAAELENVRKQGAQRVQKATRDGMRRVAIELLPALDDFERALAHAEAEAGDDEHHLRKVPRLVEQEMVPGLERAGIEPFSPLGEKFDPHLHEAVATKSA